MTSPVPRRLNLYLRSLKKYSAAFLLLLLYAILMLRIDWEERKITTESMKTNNITLAILMIGRFGNNLFQTASGVAIADYYKVSNSKLDQTNFA